MFKVDLMQQYKLFKGLSYVSLGLAVILLTQGEVQLAVLAGIFSIAECIVSYQKLGCVNRARVEAKIDRLLGGK